MNPLGSRRIWRETVGKNPPISVGNTASTKSPDYSGTGQFRSVFFDLGYQERAASRHASWLRPWQTSQELCAFAVL